MNIPKIKQFENKNQFIIEDGDKTIFQSYESIIAIYERDTKRLTLGKHWDYSNTTSKHLYLFLNDEVYTIEAENGEQEYLNIPDTGKRNYIRKLIENKVIKYDEELV